jgi:hypothetical protein
MFVVIKEQFIIVLNILFTDQPFSRNLGWKKTFAAITHIFVWLLHSSLETESLSKHTVCNVLHTTTQSKRAGCCDHSQSRTVIINSVNSYLYLAYFHYFHQHNVLSLRKGQENKAVLLLLMRVLHLSSDSASQCFAAKCHSVSCQLFMCHVSATKLHVEPITNSLVWTGNERPTKRHI